MQKFSTAMSAAVTLLFAAVSFGAVPLVPPLGSSLARLHPRDLFPYAASNHFVMNDSSPKDKPATFSIVGSSNDKPVFRARMIVPSRYAYAAEVHWDIDTPMKAGSVGLVRFTARAVEAKQESGEGDLTVTFQKSSPPYDKSLRTTISVGPEWSVYDIPFKVVRDFAKGEAAFSFNFGTLQQTLEIAGVELLDFEDRAQVDQLPATRFTYAGREEGAAWRVKALKRIEAVRTAPIAIKVVDKSGHPVAGAKVTAEMTRSEFLFGSEVDAEYLFAATPDAEQYRKTFLEFFNTATIGNGLKWNAWLDPQRRKTSLAAVDWLNANNIRVRGHNLVWPGWKFMPQQVVNDPDRDKKLDDVIESHIMDETSALRGKVVCWDVINEPVHETDVFKVLPRESMVKWYETARAGDPGAQLALNEYAMLNGAESPAMIGNFLELVHFLRDRGANLDVLGVQGHVGALPRPPQSVLRDLNLLGAEGLPIQITEFDVQTDDEQLQADYTRDFLIACYSNPSVTGFVMWGFYQPKHWKPTAAMFRTDWSEKPNAGVWRDLVLEKWRTKLKAETSAAGSFDGVGHRGTYHVTATFDGKTAESDVALTKAGVAVELVLK